MEYYDFFWYLDLFYSMDISEDSWQKVIWTRLKILTWRWWTLVGKCFTANESRGRCMYDQQLRDPSLCPYKLMSQERNKPHKRIWVKLARSDVMQRCFFSLLFYLLNGKRRMRGCSLDAWWFPAGVIYKLINSRALIKGMESDYRILLSIVKIFYQLG